MTAQIHLAPGNPGPVNEGERVVLRDLAERLPDNFELHPNLQIQVNGGMIEVDIVVFGPDCMWLVEVKDLAGDVRVEEHVYMVNGEPRSHVVDAIQLKAQKLKSRLSLLPDLQSVWIQPIVVLARKPHTLHIADNMKKRVVMIDRAVQVISDPTLIGLYRDRLPENLRHIAKARLAVDSTERPPRSKFGEYEATDLLSSGGGVSWWRAKHQLLGNEVLLEVQAFDPIASEAIAQQRKAAQLRAVRVGQVLGAHPNLLAPVTAFVGDDGSLVVVHPQSPSPVLEVIDVTSLEESVKRRAVSGLALLLAHCNRNGVAHRSIGPSVIHISSQGHLRLTGFGLSKLAAVGGATVAPADWGALGDMWAAPEHNGGEVGHEADLFALGKLIEALWPDGAPTDLQIICESLTALQPADRQPSAAEVSKIARGEPQAPPAEKAGGTIAERYVLGKQIGSGAHANVWAASDTLTGINVALKIYEAPDAGDQVQREFSALDQIDHQSVVRVRDIARLDGKWALVTELLEGPDLRAFMLDSERIEVERASAIALRILTGLSAIHPEIAAIKELLAARSKDQSVDLDRLAELQSAGVVHRDIKPENIILVEGRGPVLVDFGLSAGVGGGVSGGTIAYRPPDVAGDGSDPDIDLFALGVILHEMLTGTHPYTDRNPLTGTFAPSGDIPAELADVVKRACAPKRSDRFANAEDFIAALVALGITDDEITIPTLDILDLMNQIDEALAAHDWDTALGLCPDEWIPVRERIERRRLLAQEADVAMPLIEVAGFSISVASTSRFELETDPGNEEHGPGDVVAYLVRGPSGELLEVLQYEADDGAIWVQGGDTYHTEMPLKRLGQGLRMSSQELDGTRFIEIRRAKIKDDKGWSTAVQTSLADLNDSTSVDVMQVLTDFGAVAVGRRSEVAGDAGKRRNELCAVFEGAPGHLPAVAFFLSRVVVLGRLEIEIR